MQTITETNICRIRIETTDIFLENINPGHGKITVSDVYGKNFSHYWGSMGKDATLETFISHINKEYFASKLNGAKKDHKMDVPRTFAAIRKYIREDMGLQWYQHMDFQQHMREVLKEFQDACENYPSQDYFISNFFSQFVHQLSFYKMTGDRHEEKRWTKEFNDISEWWHFIVERESENYLFLMQLHGKLVKYLKQKAK